jgi:hypothetical protein
MLGSQRSWNAPKICAAKQLLSHVLEREAREFAEAVTRLNEQRGTASSADYHQLGIAAEQARMRTEEARVILYHHIGGHGC